MENIKTESLNGLRKPFQTESYEKSLHDTEQNLGDVVSKFATTTSKYYNQSKDYVKQNPNKSIAIAVAAGIVTGSLMSLAMRKKQ